MTKYLLVYHGGGMPETEEAQQKEIAAWGAWLDGLGAAVIDGGNPTGASKTISSDGAVSDGGGPNPVSGYGIIEADGIDDAVSKAKGCPILASGGSIEVGEIFDVGG